VPARLAGVNSPAGVARPDLSGVVTNPRRAAAATCRGRLPFCRGLPWWWTRRDPFAFLRPSWWRGRLVALGRHLRDWRGRFATDPADARAAARRIMGARVRAFLGLSAGG